MSFYGAKGEPSRDKLAQREEILQEMLESERVFTRYLQTLVEVYFQPLEKEATTARRPFISRKQVDAIFGALEHGIVNMEDM